MGVWSSLQSRLVNRRQEKEREVYNRGYNWAAGVLLRGEMPAVGIQAMTDKAYSHPPIRMTHFDFGTIDALEQLIEEGVIEDDRV